MSTIEAVLPEAPIDDFHDLPEATPLPDVRSMATAHIELERRSDDQWAAIGEKALAEDFTLRREGDKLIIEGDTDMLHALLELGQQLKQGTEEPLLPFSPAIEQDPGAELSLEDELERFAAYIDTKPMQLDFVERAREQLGPSRANVHDLRTIVAIPVAGHQEYKTIYHSLEQFAQQDMPTSQYEVTLFLNLPGGSGERDAELSNSVSRTIDEIERFKQAYPRVNVRYVTNVYRGASRKIGAIRADLWNIIAYDLHQRGRRDDLLVISGDADIDELNRSFLSDMTGTFERTGADIVTSNLKWQPIPGLGSDAIANRILRLQTHLDQMRDRHSPTLMTPDAATALSLAAYLASGGFDKTKALGEMIDLTRHIRGMRSLSEDEYRPAKTVEAKAQRAVLRTNSRRLAKAMELGHSPYEAWSPEVTGFGTDDSLRTEDPNLMAIEASAEFLWPAWVEAMLERYTQPVPPEKRAMLQQKLREMLGFEI